MDKLLILFKVIVLVMRKQLNTMSYDVPVVCGKWNLPYHETLPKKKSLSVKIPKGLILLVENIGVEPMTSSLPAKRSSQLS